MAGDGAPSIETASLYERIGGAPAVGAVVERFYEAVLADPLLAPFFAGADVGRLRAHQHAFLSAALGGPDRYRGRHLRRAHGGLGISDGDFDRVVEHLVAALGDCGVPPDAVASVTARIAGARDEVVQR